MVLDYLRSLGIRFFQLSVFRVVLRFGSVLLSLARVGEIYENRKLKTEKAYHKCNSETQD